MRLTNQEVKTVRFSLGYMFGYSGIGSKLVEVMSGLEVVDNILLQAVKDATK